MSRWICIHCGTTIDSKCPGHRREFFGPELEILKSVVTIDRVDDHRNYLSELFISYTCGAERKTADVIRTLADSLTKEGVAEALTCNHYWVMNSETERQCCLDHDHDNLGDIPRLKQEIADLRKKRTVQDEVRGFAQVAITPIDLARRALNLAKGKYDHFVEHEFDVLKGTVREAMTKLANGKPCRPMYRIHMAGNRWGDGCAYAYFDREEDAIALARGMHCKLDIEKLNTEDDSGYQSIEYELATTCYLCGKPNNHETELIIDAPEGLAHLTCINRAKRDNTVKVRYARFVVKNKKIHIEWEEFVNIRRSLGVEGIDTYINEDRNCTHVYVKAETTKPELDKLVNHLKTVVFI